MNDTATSEHYCKSPVLFLIFNRPDTTRQVFEAIRAARPPRLYVAADGPRSSRSGEAEKCEEARQIATAVDWDCEVKTIFREGNLGCKYAVAGALDWFFEQENEGIILEDDCLPTQSFFLFCDQMLQRYRDDARVFLVSGYNKQQKWNTSHGDYFFSNYGGIWGWASWRRAWENYEPEMEMLDTVIARQQLQHLLGRNDGQRRGSTLLRVKKHEIDSWAYPWGFARHINNGLACVPRVSLVENIGFGEDATHTTSRGGDGVHAQELSFPLKHNPIMIPDRDYDALFHPRASMVRRIAGRIWRFGKTIMRSR